MKLLRWSLAGASAFVIYKYSIGKKAKGDDVFNTPERTLANAKEDGNVRAAAKKKVVKPKANKRPGRNGA